MAKLTGADLAAVVKTIELIERDGWDDDKRLAANIRAWMKGKL